MSLLELRQNLHDQLDQISEDELPKIRHYLDTMIHPLSESMSERSSTGASILAALKSVGTWQGDDFKACLSAVYDSRSIAESHVDDNPFDR